MAFPSSSRRSLPRPPRLAVVLAVGQQVFVNSLGIPPRPVELGDESGAVLSGEYLSDGAEVEVIAWRPRGAADTRYRVRARDGAVGWVAAGNLRRSVVPPPPAASPPPTAATAPRGTSTADEGRRFGARRF